MAAMEGISAILMEEAGFDGIWASGFEYSAAMGLSDVSLVSMAEHLTNMRNIADRTALPIIVDVDYEYYRDAEGSGGKLNAYQAETIRTLNLLKQEELRNADVNWFTGKSRLDLHYRRAQRLPL